MTARVAVADLSRALSAAGCAVAKYDTIPILRNVLISAATGSMTVSGSNCNMWIKATIPSDGDFGPVTLPAHLLTPIARSAPAAEITMSQRTATAAIVAGSASYTLHTLPAADWPAPREGAVWKPVFSGPVATIAPALEMVMPAAARQETVLPVLCGVLIRPDKQGFPVFVGHDRKLLLRSRPDLHTMIDIDPFVIPLDCAAVIKPIFAGHGDEIAVDIRDDGHMVRFASPSVEILSKLLAPEGYPNEAILEPPDTLFEIESSEFLAAVAQASIASEDGDLTMVVTATDLTISAFDVVRGESSVVVPVLAKQSTEFGVYARQITAMVKSAAPSGGKVSVGLGGKPHSISITGGERSQAFVPPVAPRARPQRMEAAE